MSELIAEFTSAQKQVDAGFSARAYSPCELREAIASLVAADDVLLADALGAVALSAYPDSEDVLAICSLLAQMRQDWDESNRLLGHMISLNGMSATPAAWQHWIRSLVCAQDFENAERALLLGMAEHPGDVTLEREAEQFQAVIDKLVDASLAPIKN